VEEGERGAEGVRSVFVVSWMRGGRGRREEGGLSGGVSWARGGRRKEMMVGWIAEGGDERSGAVGGAGGVKAKIIGSVASAREPAEVKVVDGEVRGGRGRGIMV
jgi:hypothetical protein